MIKMQEVVELASVRRKKAAGRAFARWPRRLGHTPNPEVKLTDLPDSVLADLAELGPKASLALYDLILGVRDLGPGERFSYLDAKSKVEALDAFLFLADQVRFEMMRRLGWVKGLPGEEYCLVDLALEQRRIKNGFQPAVPDLCPAYHGYEKLKRRFSVEPAAVVRSLIGEALEAFKSRLRRYFSGVEEGPGGEGTWGRADPPPGL